MLHGGWWPGTTIIIWCTLSGLRLRSSPSFYLPFNDHHLIYLHIIRIAPSVITKVFISHLHGDHLYGLVPIILETNISHKASLENPTTKWKHKRQHGERATLEIYGPPGLYNYICMVLALSCSKVNYLNVHVIELVGGREEQGPLASRPRQRGRRNIFLAHYPEIESPLIRRKYLQQVRRRKWDIKALHCNPTTLFLL